MISRGFSLPKERALQSDCSEIKLAKISLKLQRGFTRSAAECRDGNYGRALFRPARGLALPATSTGGAPHSYRIWERSAILAKNEWVAEQSHHTICPVGSVYGVVRF